MCGTCGASDAEISAVFQYVVLRWPPRAPAIWQSTCSMPSCVFVTMVVPARNLTMNVITVCGVVGV